MPTILFCGAADDKVADCALVLEKCRQALGVEWRPASGWHLEYLHTINQISATSFPLVLLLPGWIHRADAPDIMNACMIAKAVTLELRDFSNAG